jgi:hypothetical protein
MVSRSSLILIFAILFAAFILAPPFLGQPFSLYPSMHVADILDLLTPWILLPIYWLLFTDSGRVGRALAAVLTFIILAALWAQGQGMHLSANSISNLFGPGGTEVHRLIHFYDEVLSHYLWHIGIIGLSVLLTFLPAGPGRENARVRWGWTIPAVILYGFTYFAAVIEGGTTPVGLPAAVLIPVGVLLFRRRELGSHNLIAFFFWGYVLAAVLATGWCLFWGRCIEFSQAGLL